MWIVVLLNESGAPCGNRDEDLLLTQRERGIILVMNTELPIIYLARHAKPRGVLRVSIRGSLTCLWPEAVSETPVRWEFDCTD